ncbi:sodium:proton antiporter NhaD [Thiospirillum jenense]|uniref:Sodium:proton antiporter NhaD n=2 Tax=Thiospirillum jenense TaxID=1653858 RepID=A0A839HHB7_9GAMM|nr:sodium:proton antiporter NhaD [Thiospirillum jenense]
MRVLLLLVGLVIIPTPTFAADPAAMFDLTIHPLGISILLLFMAAYAAVMVEEFTHLRKSKPVIFAAGLIWLLIAIYYNQHGDQTAPATAVRHHIMEFAELFLFLLAAMTYINTLEERRVFDALRAWLIQRGFSYRQLFWLTGWLAFFISALADNLTTALLMCAVVLAVGVNNPKFIGLACINIVVAANAGGAFSPFGDITTLMVWQKGLIAFQTFFLLFIPAVVSYLIPAALMYRAIPDTTPTTTQLQVSTLRGAKRIILLFLLTIATAVVFHHYFHLPPVLGMMTGLAYLKFFGFYLKHTHSPTNRKVHPVEDGLPFDIFSQVARAEWDTLLFFYGVILCVGGLGFIGYLELLSQFSYGTLGATAANTLIGLLSAVVDNIPVMFAVLTMNPDMSQGQWLLVTMTAGIGGSLLSIGSAAGVALMGQARGHYTFFGHLRWTLHIALGYFAAIVVHLLINAHTFSLPAGH